MPRNPGWESLYFCVLKMKKTSFLIDIFPNEFEEVENRKALLQCDTGLHMMSTSRTNPDGNSKPEFSPRLSFTCLAFLNVLRLCFMKKKMKKKKFSYFDVLITKSISVFTLHLWRFEQIGVKMTNKNTS